MVAMESAHDPKPSIRVEDGVIVEMDGKERAEFDFIDQFIADNAIDVSAAERAMSMSSAEIAQMIVDPRVTRDEVVAIARGLTPAKLLAVLKTMNVVEMMMGMQKMRARRTPANQAHSTSVRDNPLQVAVDAAEAALRGFAEVETTVGVVRYAPLVALGLQVGGQTGRGGVLTQCALEEATELELGMRGITGYAETISVYGTETVFIDGDDTPWSKAFLASAYASRGIKMRFTSGTGSEVQMGNAEGKSMLYLEIRCMMVSQGRRRAGAAERFDQLHRRSRRGPVGDPRGAGREPRREPAGPRVRLGQRSDVLPLGHAAHRAVAACRCCPGPISSARGTRACRTTTTCSPAPTWTPRTTTTGT